jgi:hypothetical protein
VKFSSRKIRLSKSGGTAEKQTGKRNFKGFKVTYDHFIYITVTILDFHNLVLSSLCVAGIEVLPVLIGKVLKGSQVQIQKKSHCTVHIIVP